MKQILTAVFVIWTAAAVAQTLHGVTEGPRRIGAGGGGVSPPACNGVIDASIGCVIPMLGIL